MDLEARYSRQVLFQPIGDEGQKKISQTRVGILGAGALGTNIANLLTRSGFGKLIIADYDKVELSNLPRQMLFTENDVGKNKAIACKASLEKINSSIQINHFANKIDSSNFADIFANVDLIMDATDNFETRFLINEHCLKFKIPWIHTGVTASNGQSVLFVPGQTACYRCLIKGLPDQDDFPNVHNSGIIAPTVTILASISCATVLRLIVESKVDYDLKFYDCWEQKFQKFTIEKDKDCQFCQSKE